MESTLTDGLIALIAALGGGTGVAAYFKYRSSASESAIKLANSTFEMAQRLNKNMEEKIDDFSKQVDESRVVIDTLLSENRKLVTSNERLMNANAILVEEIEKLRTEVRKLLDENHGLTIEREALIIDMKSLQKQLYDFGVRIDKAPAEVKSAALEAARELKTTAIETAAHLIEESKHDSIS